jgi:hypothetical protein
MLEQMSKAIAATSSAHSISHERTDNGPSWSKTRGHTSVCEH